jgi:hypothetical protein
MHAADSNPISNSQCAIHSQQHYKLKQLCHCARKLPRSEGVIDLVGADACRLNQACRAIEGHRAFKHHVCIETKEHHGQTVQLG